MFMPPERSAAVNLAIQLGARGLYQPFVLSRRLFLKGGGGLGCAIKNNSHPPILRLWTHRVREKGISQIIKVRERVGIVFTMPRAACVVPGGVIFQVLNRANARSRIFDKDQD